MNPNKTRAIQVRETPTNTKELRLFLGILNYFRRFIRNCSKIAKPLSELTKNVPFNWSITANSALQELKNAIINAPVLTQFDPKRKIFLTTDACKHAIGAFMAQGHDNGRHSVAFISSILNQHEQNYRAHDLELLGILSILRTWRCYLYGNKFVVHTDHHPLKYFETKEFLPQDKSVRSNESLVRLRHHVNPRKAQTSCRWTFKTKTTITEPNEYSKESLTK